MSKHNFQETLDTDNESDLRKTQGYDKVYNDLKNNFLVQKMHQNAPQSMQIFNFFRGRPPIPPLQEGETPSRTFPMGGFAAQRRYRGALVLRLFSNFLLILFSILKTLG